MYLRKSANGYWILWFGNINKWFQSFEAAEREGKKIWKRYYKENAAFSMIEKIAQNILTIQELDFVRKLQRSRCKGISLKQYGYLKGIYERQQREW